MAASCANGYYAITAIVTPDQPAYSRSLVISAYAVRYKVTRGTNVIVFLRAYSIPSYTATKKDLTLVVVKRGLILNMGFIKRNDILSGTDAASRVDDKRGFDRLTSGFVKKDDMLEDKEDKNDNSNIESDEYETDMNKRRFDRISNGSVKRPQENTNSSDDHKEDNRYFERLNAGFI
ncbi:hypothetical protein DPMN_135325 [Dreissena polymorpha]|uniref:Uncharacterized protein n=1 Tax=Dreissena polymorpha TaxID=45954 RepID=A0A9D4FXE7_DREPO|nr:hypothetical protein DPMN_135325 [Dreissena polymorpha]